MILLSCISILLFVVLCEESFSTQSDGPHCKQTCTTPACVQVAAQILQKLDGDVNPCDDFYKFACGRYPEDALMTKQGMNEVSSQAAYDPMYNQLVGIIESTTSEDPESVVYKRKVIYNSCLNSHDLRKEIMLMKKRLSEYYIPNWPSIVDSTPSDIDRWLARLLMAEEFAFVNTEILFSSPELYETYFSNRGLTVPSYIRNSLVIRMMTSMSSLFDFCPDSPKEKLIDFLHIIMDDLEFSVDVAREIIEDAVYVDRLIQNVTSEDLSDTLYDADCRNASKSNRWCRVFDLLIKYAPIKGDFSNAEFKFSQPASFLALDELLSTLPGKAIANHLAVRFLLNNLNILSHFARSFNFLCTSSYRGWTDYRFLNRRQSCASFVVAYLPLLVAQEYISVNNISGHLLVLRNVLKQLLNAAVEIVDATWMSGNMKRQIESSLAQTTIDQLEYVSIVTSLNNIKSLYIDLKPDSGHFFRNIEASKWTKTVGNLQRYEEGYFHRLMLQLNPFNTNARSGEDISMGFGFYHIPYTGPSLPSFVYYARFGYILAHEIVHNVHSTLYDNMNSSKKAFEKYENCINDLFSTFLIPVLNIPTKANLNFHENFADVLGKQIAFNAYIKDVLPQQPHQKLPGLGLFPLEQLFLVLSAQDWCEFGSDFEQYWKNQHSPSEHRINGPSMNLESFSKTFNCRKGSPMNPDKKCKLKK